MKRPTWPGQLWTGLLLIVLPALTLLSLLAYLAGVKAPALQETRETVARTFEVIVAAQSLRETVKDAERAQRGYLLTSSQDYLAPYKSAAAQAPVLLARLRTLTLDSEEQQGRMPALEKLLAVKFDEMNQTLAAHERGGVRVASGIIATNVGLEAMRSIGATIDSVIAAEQTLLQARTLAAVEQERSAARIALAGTALAFLAMIAGLAAILGAFRKVRRAEEARLAATVRLEQQQRELAQLQKMDALGRLTGGIAHDFNNLLHVIKNSLEIMKLRLKPADAVIEKYLDMANRNADRAAALTRQLLTFARRQVLDPKPLDPNRLVSNVTTLIRQAVGEAIDIETVIGAGAWWIAADASHLEVALLNLAVNAKDAMPNGGKLTIEIANVHLDEVYARLHAEVKAGQYLMIAVSDNGTGMPPEVAARVFEPFFTTKDPGRGTGLGLAQVFGFAKQSNGHVSIYSEPGAGTTVKLYMPRLYGEPEPQHPKPAEVRDVPTGLANAAILVVEDERDVASFTADILKSIGCRVFVAGDGTSALHVLEREPEVALLFTDVGLPGGMNGRQLADRARKHRPGLKVLFTTAYTQNAIIHHGHLDPGVSVIPKPYSRSTLTAKISEILAGD